MPAENTSIIRTADGKFFYLDHTRKRFAEFSPEEVLSRLMMIPESNPAEKTAFQNGIRMQFTGKTQFLCGFECNEFLVLDTEEERLVVWVTEQFPQGVRLQAAIDQLGNH